MTTLIKDEVIAPKPLVCPNHDIGNLGICRLEHTRTHRNKVVGKGENGEGRPV